MIKEWLTGKKIKPCKYCGSDNIGFYLQQGTKIERYGVVCLECGRGLGWLPDIMMAFIIKEGFQIIHESERLLIRRNNHAKM